ncbi:hypothetical protein [Paraburkholderia sp. XV]|uniref:hypothetical protein n=1 Tax=Paraburkholderia sp. XV TaxID=2831520 RepID=UPI001CD354C2|nr:hypothetical protein [Paraburkholderia sp. XV]
MEIVVADAARDRRQVPREQLPQNVKREQRDEKRICDIRKRRAPLQAAAGTQKLLYVGGSRCASRGNS